MIFLMKDRHFVVVDSTLENDKKAMKWFRRQRKNIGAVMIDCSSRLHSDCYAMVYADKLKTEIPRTKVWYKIALVEDDLPLDDAFTIDREFECRTVSEFYNITALLYQLDRSDAVGDIISLGTKIVTVVELGIIQAPLNEPVFWNHEEKIVDFLERFDMVLNTDKILAIPMPVIRSKQVDIEKGYYITRPSNDGGMHLTYQFHDQKYMLRLSTGYWTLEDSDFHWDILDSEILGICMNGTGLVYLGTGKVIYNMLDTEGVRVEVCYEAAHDPTVYVTDYEAYNVVDLFYMALFLPQIWDMVALFENMKPSAVKISMTFSKHWEIAETIVLPKPEEEDRGIEMDMFGCFAALINSTPRRDISFDD